MAARRKSSEPVGPPPGWEVSEEYQLTSTVTLRKGDECKIKNAQGSFVFIKHVVNTNKNPPAEWIDLWGGSTGYQQHRSVPVDMVKPMPVKRGRKRKNPDTE